MQKTLALAAPAPSLEALRSTSGIRMLRLCDASMLSNRITGVLAGTPSHFAHIAAAGVGKSCSASSPVVQH